MKGDFNREELAATVSSKFPAIATKVTANYLRVILARLVKDRTLEVRLEGGGKTLTVYRYIGGKK